VFAQERTAPAVNKHTINGYIRDSLSGEFIIGATVTISGEAKAVSSNQYGFYSITLPDGEYELSITHVSYETVVQRITLSKNNQLDIFLTPKSASMAEVLVYSRRRDANVKSTQMGQIDLSINQIKKHSSVFR
jgi:hypothetical protein